MCLGNQQKNILTAKTMQASLSGILINNVSRALYPLYYAVQVGLSPSAPSTTLHSVLARFGLGNGYFKADLGKDTNLCTAPVTMKNNASLYFYYLASGLSAQGTKTNHNGSVLWTCKDNSPNNWLGYYSLGYMGSITPGKLPGLGSQSLIMPDTSVAGGFKFGYSSTNHRYVWFSSYPSSLVSISYQARDQNVTDALTYAYHQCPEHPSRLDPTDFELKLSLDPSKTTSVSLSQVISGNGTGVWHNVAHAVLASVKTWTLNGINSAPVLTINTSRVLGDYVFESFSNVAQPTFNFTHVDSIANTTMVSLYETRFNSSDLINTNLATIRLGYWTPKYKLSQ
jgi:hypothetical protein